MPMIKMTPLASKKSTRKTVVVTEQRVYELIAQCRTALDTDGEWGPTARAGLQSKVDVVNEQIKADPKRSDDDLITLE